MAIPSIPDTVDNEPINVQERTIRQFDCPNPGCNESLDITNANIGTKVKCQNCKNVTWIPDYSKKWWQKPFNVIGGLLLSFIIGVSASLTAEWFANNVKDESQPTTIEEPANNKTNSDAN